MTATHSVQRFETVLSGSWRQIWSIQGLVDETCQFQAMKSGRRTRLIHHINEGLRVVPKEVTDSLILILTREDHFDQGGEFMRSSNQKTVG